MRGPHPSAPTSADGCGLGTDTGGSKAAGADVLVTDLCRDIDRCPYPMGTADQLDETARRCREHGGRVITAIADVRNPADARAAVREGSA